MAPRAKINFSPSKCIFRTHENFSIFFYPKARHLSIKICEILTIVNRKVGKWNTLLSPPPLHHLFMALTTSSDTNKCWALKAESLTIESTDSMDGTLPGFVLWNILYTISFGFVCLRFQVSVCYIRLQSFTSNKQGKYWHAMTDCCRNHFFHPNF